MWGRVLEAPESTRKNVNMVLITSSVFLIFGSYLTMGNIQTVIIENAKDENATAFIPGFEGDGFLSLSIVYAVSSLFDVLSPSIIAVLGLRLALLSAGAMYALFIASFFALMEELLYTASVVVGIGNAVLWIANGAFLALNSDPDTIARNSGLFYGSMQVSGLLGNTFTYFQFRDSYEIEQDEQDVFVGVLLALTAAGTAINLFILPMPWVEEKRTESADTALTGFLRAIKLMSTPAMMLLLPYFCYIGFQFSFRTGVYGPSLSFARAFGDDDDGNSLTGLHGIAAHAGVILVCGLFSVFGRRANERLGHYPLVLAGFACHCVSYATILINVPGEAPMGVTYDDALVVVPSSKGLAIFSSFILGVGSGLTDTQTLTMLGSVYKDKASQAFAIYKVCQHASTGVSFAYAGYLSLYWQLAILMSVGLAGALGFTVVDFGNQRRKKAAAGTATSEANLVPDETKEK